MKTKKQKVLSLLIAILAIIFSSILRAIAIHAFIIPNKFAPGGITGIAAIIEIISGGKINSGYSLFLLNVPLLFLAIKTLSAIILVSILLVLLGKLEVWTGINFKYTPNERILAALAGGVLGGAALATMLKIGGSSGGTDIVAALVNKKYAATSISRFIFMFDAVIVLASALILKSLDPIMLSIVEMFVGSRVSESIIQGFKTAIKFEIIIDEPDKLANVIMTKLNRGVTCIKAKGMHTNTEHNVLICLVRKRQLSAMHDLLKEYAPNSFTYISQANEVIGKGFPSS
jgi:uncharacterized membrane-anchored protein YitT (DUF2179 family)